MIQVLLIIIYYVNLIYIVINYLYNITQNNIYYIYYLYEIIIILILTNSTSSSIQKNKKYTLNASQPPSPQRQPSSYTLKSPNKYLISLIPQYQHYITIATKAIIYLFSPQIDLVDNILSNFKNYDKYHKTIEILQQLLNKFRNNNIDLEEQLLNKQSQIQAYRQGILFQRQNRINLQQKIKSLEEQSLRYKNIVLQLTKAYQQAKECFQKQMLDIKLQNNQLKCLYQRQKGRQKRRQKIKQIKEEKRVSRSKQKEVQKEGYNDNSICKRFSVSRIQQVPRIIISKAQDKESSISLSKSKITLPKSIPKSRNYHQQIIQTIQYNIKLSQSKLKTQHQHHQEQTYRHDIQSLQQKYKALQICMNQLSCKKQKEIKDLYKIIDQIGTKLEGSQKKVKEKNKIILDLMNQIDKN